MLVTLGVGMTQQSGSLSIAETFASTHIDLGVLFPSLIYTRNDSAKMVRNTQGQYYPLTPNAVPLDYDPLVQKTGTRLEAAARTNKVTTNNYDAADTNGFAIVSGTGTVSRVIDTDLTHPSDTGVSRLLDNSGGAGDFVVDIAGAVGNLNAHSVRIATRQAAAGTAGAVSLSDNSGSLALNADDTSYAWILLENVTPTDVNATLRITVAAGQSVYVALENVFESSYAFDHPIRTNGAAGTSQRDYAYIEDLASITLDDPDQGAIIVKGKYFGRGVNEQHFYALMEGNDATEAIGIRAISRQFPVGNVVSNGQSSHTNDTQKILTDRIFSVGHTWDRHANKSRLISGAGLRNDLDESAVLPNGVDVDGSLIFDRFYLGTRNQYFGFMDIWFESITIVDRYLSLKQMAGHMVPANAVLMVLGGQSNMRTNSRDETSGSHDNAGERAMIAEMQKYFPDKECTIMDTSVSGSNLVKSNANGFSNYWINDDDLENLLPGPLLLAAVEQMCAVNLLQLIVFAWNQFESDAGSMTQDAHMGFLRYLFNYIRNNVSANLIFGLEPPANRAVNAVAYQPWRQAFHDLAEAEPHIFMLPETYHVDMDPATNNLHISNQGAADKAPAFVRRIMSEIGQTVTGPVYGPAVDVANTTLNGTTVTVPIIAESGTTLLPQGAIDGFTVLDGNGSEIVITSQTLAGSTATLELASAPSGDWAVYSVYGSMNGVDYTKTIHDNSQYALRLRHAVFQPEEAAGSGTAFVPDPTNLLIHQDSSVQTSVSQRTDLTGNGFDAVQVNAALQPSVIADRINAQDALLFDEVSGNMVIATTAALAAVTDTITFEWVLEGTPIDWKTLFRNDFATTNKRGFFMQKHSNGAFLVFISTDAVERHVHLGPVGVFDGNPHHCVLRVDNGVMDFFLDGVKTTMGTYDHGVEGFGSADNIQLHAGDGLYDYAFTVFSDAKSDADIATMFTHAQSVFGIV